MGDSDERRLPTVLHVIVGHKLPIYFVNAVRSTRELAPEDDLLVVDNASELPDLRMELDRMAATDDHLRIHYRTSNDLTTNAKVGGLYDAYREIVAHALDHGYDYLHLIQSDMQMLWWDAGVVAEAQELFMRHPECVNIFTVALPRHMADSADTVALADGTIELCRYGLTDTGLYHLGRWREHGVAFEDSEQVHAAKYRAAGFRVLCHPHPTVAQVPWPAVVRNGIVKGREVAPRMPFLLRPLGTEDRQRVRASEGPVWLEDVCVPWGWVCLAPMWTTALESIDYWVFRWRDLRRRGIRSAFPRWDRSGIPAGQSVWRVERRPAIWEPIVLPPWYELKRRIAARTASSRSA